MISSYRQSYNAAFDPARYAAMTAALDARYQDPIPFRIAETPVFLPQALCRRLLEASEQIIDVLAAPDFRARSAEAVPPQYDVPNETAESLFLCLDYAICQDEGGELYPQLIELQGCASLFAYQDLLAHAFRAHFDIPAHLTHLFAGRDSEAYFDLLRTEILGGEDPKEVVLLEIDPWHQATRVDFHATAERLGIAVVCTSEVIQEGRKLYYRSEGKRTPIRRIYNRMIWDEYAQRPDKHGSFDLTREADVSWAGHPNWFFRISKHSMPLLNSPFVPQTWYLDQLDALPEDLEHYVLKPLFSFSGQGVHIDLDRSLIEGLPERKGYILQRKIAYAPLVPTPDEPAKCEVRVMYLWSPGAARPQPVINLVRLSKGKMIGVRYNKDRIWVGGTVGFMEL